MYSNLKVYLCLYPHIVTGNGQHSFPCISIFSKYISHSRKHTHTHTAFKGSDQKLNTVFIYSCIESGKIHQENHAGSENRSETVVLFQRRYNLLFTEQAALKLKTLGRERGSNRKQATDRYDILPVLFLQLCPTDITGSSMDRELQHLV